MIVRFWGQVAAGSFAFHPRGSFSCWFGHHPQSHGLPGHSDRSQGYKEPAQAWRWSGTTMTFNVLDVVGGSVLALKQEHLRKFETPFVSVLTRCTFGKVIALADLMNFDDESRQLVSYQIMMQCWCPAKSDQATAIAFAQDTCGLMHYR